MLYPTPYFIHRELQRYNPKLLAAITVHIDANQQDSPPIYESKGYQRPFSGLRKDEIWDHDLAVA